MKNTHGRFWNYIPTIVLILMFAISSIDTWAGNVQSLLGTDQTPGDVAPLAIDTAKTGLVIAEGWAKIHNGNVDQARLAALRMAYAEAVGRVSGLEIGSLTLIRNVKQVTDIVMSRSRGFIRSYAVIHEGVSDTDPEKYEVRIEADVVEDRATKLDEQEGLQLYLALLGNPRILIVLPEKQFKDSALPATGAASSQEDKIEIENREMRIKIESSSNESSAHQTKNPVNNADQGTVLGSAEAALAQAFSNYGYQVITSDDLLAQGLIEPHILKQAKAGVTAQAVKVARAANADIALLGIMRVSQNKIKPAGVSLTMVTAEASAKALIVSNGRLVKAFHRHKRSSAPSELVAYASCMDKVANEMAAVLAWKIPQILVQENRQTRLVVHGIDLSLAERLKLALSKKSGVELVRFSRLPTTQNQTAVFLLLTGFVRIAIDEVLKTCTSTLNRPLAIARANKYEIELMPADIPAKKDNSGTGDV